MIKDNGLDFPLTGTVTLNDVKKAQKRLLEMALFIRDVFEANNINYTIMFGTLIGAVRHKGFIPWDLDFDFGVTEDDYNKAMECISSVLPDRFVIQNIDTDKNYCAFWSKIVDKNSIAESSKYSNDNNFTYKGLHVDIYMLKRTNEANYEYNLLCDNKQYFALKYKRGFMTEKEYDETIQEIDKSLRLLTKNNEKNDEYYFLKFFKSNEKVLFPLKKYSYEGYLFSGPQDYDQFLRGSYYKGDYMIPPKYEDRDIKLSSITFLD